MIQTARPLRDYQIACVDATLSALASGERNVYYQLPTGGGKTRVAAELIEKIQCGQGQILFLAHRKELIWQTRDSLQADLPGYSIGVVMAEESDLDANVLVCSVQTLSRGRLEQIFQSCVYSSARIQAVLIDECHHITLDNVYGKLISKIWAAYPDAPIIGCTATPYRADKASLQEVLPTCTFSRTIENLQEAKYLAPTKWCPIHINSDWTNLKRTTKDGEQDYNEKELAERVYPHLQDIVEKTLPMLQNRPTVVFACDVTQAKKLTELYTEESEKGYDKNLSGLAFPRAMAIWGDMPSKDRRDILGLWRKGAVQIVVNVGILTEGFDFPNLAALVIARPTMSPGLYLQMIGRVTRPKSDIYSDGLIIDVVGNANLIETKQVVLPKVQEAVNEYAEYVMDSPAVLDEAEPLTEADFDHASELDKKPRTYKILDPMGKSWVAWGRETGVYYASLGNEATALLKRDERTGLWNGYILWPSQEERGKWHKKTATSRPKPLSEMMQHVNQIIASNGRKHLVEKTACWRNDPCSSKQCNYLSKFDAAEGQKALKTGWSKGDVALRITYHQVKHLIERLG